MNATRGHIPSALAQMVGDYLPTSDRMKLELPAVVVQNIVNPFMSLLDDALIEAEYYLNGGVINTDKWLNKLEEVSPKAYNHVISYPKGIGAGAIDVVWRNVDLLTDDVLVICLMIMQRPPAEVDFWRWRMDDDDTLLLYAMLARADSTKLFFQIANIIRFPWYATALYLLQHGARTDVDTVMDLINMQGNIPNLDNADGHKLFVRFMAVHPEIYDSDTTILNYVNPQTREPLFSMYQELNPAFAAQLLDTPGLKL